MVNLVILEAGTLGDDIDLSVFETLAHVTIYEKSTEADTKEKIKDADIIIVNKVPMNQNTLEDTKHLKLIALTATGVNNIDFEYTKKHGIKVANVKGYSTQSVIQHTFALLFYLYEKLAYYDNYVKSEEYVKNDIFSHFGKSFSELFKKRWGIIGLGEIGKGVADIAKGFGCDVIYYSTTGKNNNKEYQQVTLSELLQSSDIISIHAPLTEKTVNLISVNELKQMKKEAILINVGRGAIVDQKALAEALMNGTIAGSGLDVLTEEPIRADNPLLKIKDSTKLIITPHIAWATVEARKRCVKEVYKNIEAFLNGTERNIVLL